jgi:hypothetical protein
MQSSQDALQDLTKCTVAIQKSTGGLDLGTGVIVTDNGLILTCYHVVGNIKTKTLDKAVDIYFPSAPQIKGHANLLEEYCDPELDVALLQLQETKFPSQTTSANLGETIYAKEHKFQSFGFKNPLIVKFEGLPANGIIQAKTRKKSKDSVLSPLVIVLKSDQIDKGMSGAPVLDTETNKVVGIISDHYKSRYASEDEDIYKTLSLAIPIESIVKVCPLLKEKNSGLLKIHEFMTKIGLGGGIYNRFDDLYVPPIEYEEIYNTLEESRCVFITGTKEYGKTYTAIKLLWEYYKKDYTPNYVEYDSQRAQGLCQIIKRLLDLNEGSKKQVIYFEDPVGKTKYVPNEEFERSISAVINVLNTLDVYVIITMREDIYQEFSPVGEIHPEKHVKKLNIGKQLSYDYEKRKEMLLRWASVMNCKWLDNENLKTIVLQHLENEKILPTPLNIKDFVMATSGKSDKLDITNEQQLLLIKLNELSKETVKSFAQDIESMSEYKLLFLSFPFIYDGFPVSFNKTNYQQLVRKLKLEEDAWEFDKVLDLFKDDKIEITNEIYSPSEAPISGPVERIRFSHPSYFEAFQFAISSKHGSITKVGKILSTVLLELAENEDAYRDVANTVAYNFDKLPENVQNLLFKLAENEHTAGSVASGISRNFSKLPENVQNLLFKLAENEHTAGSVARAIGYSVDKLPENVQNLLFKLAENGYAAFEVATSIFSSFDKFPEHVRNELLLKLADKRDSQVSVPLTVAYNFDKLPENVQNLLFKLAENEHTAGSVALGLSNNFDKFPEHVRNELLLKLAENKYPGGSVPYIVANNFSKLPENVQNLLFKLAENEDAYRDVANTVAYNFDKLPENVQNLLFKLAENEHTAGSVASGISNNFDKFPEHVRNELLLKLAENKEAARYVSYAVDRNFDKLPENVRNELQKIIGKYGY